MKKQTRKTAKLRTVYYVTVEGPGTSHSQYLQPNELHYIKTWLNQGYDSVLVTKCEMTQEMHRATFA